MIEYSKSSLLQKSLSDSSDEKVALPSLSSARTAWQNRAMVRPLLPLSALAIGGCALGFALARDWNCEVLHEIAPFWWSFALLISHFAFVWKSRFDARATPLCALLILALWALFAARRSTPAPDDIAQMVRRPPNASLPQRRLETQLRGVIGDEPRRSDFGLEFTLQTNRVLDLRTLDAQKQWRKMRGCVWVRLALPPRDAQISATQMPRAGDAVTITGALADLPRAGNAGERENRARFIENRCWCVAQIREFSACKIRGRAAEDSFARRLNRAREWISTRYFRQFQSTKTAYPQASAQLLVAMVFGESGLSEPLPRATRDRFRAAGMSHLLVASGTQVAFLAAILLVALRFFGVRRGAILFLVLPILIGYALLTGGAASIWRATLAGACVAWALFLGRDIDGLSLWSLAVLLLLGLDPMQAQNLGFQLTFAATWGLLAVAPPLRQLLQSQLVQRQLLRSGTRQTSRFEERVLEMAALTCSAQIATIPLLFYHFGRFSFLALGSNFAAIPLAGIAVASGILGLFLPLGNFNFGLVRAIDGVATLAANAPGAQSQTPPLSLFWTLGAYAILLAALFTAHASSTRNTEKVKEIFMQKWRDQWRLFRITTRFQGIFAALVLLISLAMTYRIFAAQNRDLRVTLLDVGQGESIVIEAPNGKTVLIDGGTSGDEGRGEVGRAVIVPSLQAAGISKIDVMILTHADADHCSALPQVVREIPVGLALDGAAFYAENSRVSSTRRAPSVPEYEATKAAWRERNVEVRAARSGQKIDLGDGASLRVLAPSAPALDGDNDNAAVVRLDYGQTSFLFTADIEAPAEARLLQRGADLHCTVLKVAHHGSKTSTTRAFLQAANPSLAILSCGRYNSFGHPAPATLQTLASQKILTLRTDISGAISVACDGRECRVQPFR